MAPKPLCSSRDMGESSWYSKVCCSPCSKAALKKATTAGVYRWSIACRVTVWLRLAAWALSVKAKELLWPKTKEYRNSKAQILPRRFCQPCVLANCWQRSGRKSCVNRLIKAADIVGPSVAERAADGWYVCHCTSATWAGALDVQEWLLRGYFWGVGRRPPGGRFKCPLRAASSKKTHLVHGAGPWPI